MARRLAICVCAALMATSAATCGGNTSPDGDEPCPIAAKVRPSSSDLLSTARSAGDVFWLSVRRVERDEVLDVGADLFSDDAPLQHDALDLLAPTEQLSMRLLSHSPVGGEVDVRLMGGTAPFSCETQRDDGVTLYLGAASDYAPGPDIGERIGSTVTAIDDHRALVFGGQTSTGEPSSPAAVLYEHDTGEGCAEQCLAAIPQSRVDHTATKLPDGRVVIVGGMHPGGGVATDVLVFDPGEGRFDTVASSEPALRRSRHAAVLLLDDDDILPSVQGSIAIFGGVGEDGTGALSTAALLSTTAWTVQLLGGDLLPGRFDATAALTPGGMVFIAGGWNASGERTGAIDLFDAAVGGNVQPASFVSCGAQAQGALCAKRAGHSATVLGDGSVLFWGGASVVDDGGETNPVAEVLVLSSPSRLLPVADEDADSGGPRQEHSATQLDCLEAPCSVLIAGGVHPDNGQVAPDVLFSAQPSSQQSPTATFFQGAFASLPGASSRHGHTATVLGDGSVLMAGGTEASAPATTVLLHTPCSLSDNAQKSNLRCPR